MFSHGYIKHDFDVVRVGCSGIPGEGRVGGARGGMAEAQLARLPPETALEDGMSARLG